MQIPYLFFFEYALFLNMHFLKAFCCYKDYGKGL